MRLLLVIIRRPGLAASIAAAVGGAAMEAAGVWAQTLNDTRVRVDVLVQGLTQPAAMAYLGASGAFLVGQKGDGKVLYFAPGATTGQVILDLAVNTAGERGLLGMAIDPGWEFSQRPRYVYLYYTESSTGADTADLASVLGNRVYRYTYQDGPPRQLIDPVLVLDLPATPGPDHNGGVLRFGPDDTLYTVVGDQSRTGKLQNEPTGADPDDTSVVLRIDTSGRPVAGNPFLSPGGNIDPADRMSRSYGYGVRNSLGLTLDPVTGRLWDTETGPNAYDEVNLVVPGLNSGWSRIMGPSARDHEGTADLWVAPGSVYRDPDFSWMVPVAPGALSFVLSPKLGCGLRNDLLVGDGNCGNLYRFHPNAARDGLAFASPALLDHVADNAGLVCSAEMSEILYGTGFGVVADMITEPSRANDIGGAIDLVSLSHGRIYRLSPNSGAFPDADGDGVDDACDCALTDRLTFAPPVEVPLVRIAWPYSQFGAPTTAIAWDMQNASTGGATRATIVSGDLDALRYTDDYSRACALGTSLLFPPFNDTRPDPPPGYGYYYLVRAGNSCGPGTYGDGFAGVGTGAPDPRDALDAAVSLPVCGLCTGRAGGAIITFDIVGESLRVWITNGPFIDKAKQFLASGTQTQLPIFYTLLDGRDCDPQWTWHPDPMNVVWADAAIEVCDGRPSSVEADKDYWFQIGFCPWSARVTAVADQR